jgi:hypothetical protein
MQTTLDWSATITTNCQCMDEDPETGEDREAEACHGCDEWMLGDAYALLADWQRAWHEPEAALIEGKGMGWRRLSGYAIARASSKESTGEAILNKLMLDGDFTLTLKLEGDNLTATRSSHDEPTGCSFIVSAFMPCQGSSECMAKDGLGNYDGRVLCGSCAEWEGMN